MSVKVNLKICVPYPYVTELYRGSATSDTNCSNQKPTVLKHLNSLRVSLAIEPAATAYHVDKGAKSLGQTKRTKHQQAPVPFTSRSIFASSVCTSPLEKASAAHQMDGESHYFTGPWRFHVKLFSGINTRKNIWHILITVCQLTCDFWLWIQARRLDVITLSSIPTCWSEN